MSWIATVYYESLFYAEIGLFFLAIVLICAGAWLEKGRGGSQ